MMRKYTYKRFYQLIHELKSICPKIYQAYMIEFQNVGKIFSVDSVEEIKAENTFWSAFTTLNPAPHYNVMAEMLLYLDRAVSIERIEMFTAHESDFFKKHYPNKSETDIDKLQMDYLGNAFNLFLKDRKQEINIIEKEKAQGRALSEYAKHNPKDIEDSNLPF